MVPEYSELNIQVMGVKKRNIGVMGGGGGGPGGGGGEWHGVLGNQKSRE